MLPFFSSFFTLQQLSYCCRFLSNITLHSSLFTLHSSLFSYFTLLLRLPLLSSLFSSLFSLLSPPSLTLFLLRPRLRFCLPRALVSLPKITDQRQINSASGTGFSSCTSSSLSIFPSHHTQLKYMAAKRWEVTGL